MPIYKYSRHEVDERRAVRRHRRMKLMALTVSSLLLLGTVALVLGHRLAERIVGLPASAVLAVPDAAATVDLRGR